MRIYCTDNLEVKIIEPQIFVDDRGYFFESFRQDFIEKEIGDINFIQENESKSILGTLRGLHYQIPPFAQSKLVRVVEGRVLDIAVDIRKGSPNFGKYVAVELSEDNKRQLFIPRGFAHGFLTLSDRATFLYKVDNYYSKEHERGIFYGDEILNIKWNGSLDGVKVSDKDRYLPKFIDSECM